MDRPDRQETARGSRDISPTRSYFDQGVDALRSILANQLAVTSREVEARVADDVYPGNTHRIQPHILTRVRAHLFNLGEFDYVRHTTHGNRQVQLLVTRADAVRRRDRDTATARKAMLYGRYLSWAQGPLTDYPSGVIGIAGERVLANTLRTGRPERFVPASEAPGEVNTLLTHKLTGGPYDDAAFLVDDTRGAPTTIVVPFEMKNVRRWLYSDDDEVHKFLYRSAAFQQACPDALICPVIIARRRHSTLHRMGMDLGFYSIGLKMQFVVPTARVDQRKFEEVRNELAFTDLVLQQDQSPRLLGILSKSVRRDAGATAERWRTRGSHFVDAYDHLRTDLPVQARAESMERFRQEASEGPLDHQGGW